MRKLIKFLRGIKLIVLNSIYYKSKMLGIKFLFFLILNTFNKYLYLKIKNKNITNDFFNLIKNYKFSKNYFKHNPPIWFEIFSKNFLFEKNVNILEIGTFEGMSYLFFEKYLKSENIFCIDSFEVDNLKNNKKKFNNFNFFNMTSDKFFEKKIDIKFDIIYIDGSHKANDVFKDLINSHNSLKNDGIIIIDDFLYDLDYRRNDKFYNEVMGGVFMFYSKKFNYKILYVGHQLILKKISN